jgi:uncharacterized protein (DUF305 family)
MRKKRACNVHSFPVRSTQPAKKSLAGRFLGCIDQPAADPDLSFNQLMTVHYPSAVDMAQAQPAHGRDAQRTYTAQQMITAQQHEIQQFKACHAKSADRK